eukprot:408641_1
MATKSSLTEANQHEMQKQLAELASNHKKAKLQELIQKYDELRPYPNINNDENNKRCCSNEEIEAMKNQFNDLQKEQLDKQISKQFLLRSPELETERDTEQYEYGSDGSGDQKLNEQDFTDMRAEFDKYQKKLLSTQIEKSFRLRIPSNQNKDSKLQKNILELNDKDSKEMEQQFNAMNKMMVRMRSTKTLEMGIVNPQIKPKHKTFFKELMKDIGIINQVIVDNLWYNIEKTVNNDLNDLNDDSNDEDSISIHNESDFEAVKKLKEENQLLKQQIKHMNQTINNLHADDEDDMLIIN